MTEEFYAERVQLVDDWESVARLNSENPFLTSAYIRATPQLGTPWMLALCADTGRIATATVGYLSQGRLERALEILSLPMLENHDAFWPGLQQFCTEQRVDRLRINTFASPAASIPAIGIEIFRRPRTEFVLSLAGSDDQPKLSSNHKRNIKKAVRAGLTIKRTTSKSAGEIHAQLMNASMRRRSDRGENVYLVSNARNFERLLKTGAGVIFQVRENDQVLSSLLLLLAEKGAYYHSAGTSKYGMSVGAAPFLINELAAQLSTQGFTSLNLGGARAEQGGLTRFKSGFGCGAIPLEAAEFYLGSRLRKSVISAIRSIRKRSILF